MQQLAALLITRQVIGNVKEALVPFVIEKLKLFKIGYSMTEAMSPDTLDKHVKEITGETEEDSQHVNGEIEPAEEASETAAAGSENTKKNNPVTSGTETEAQKCESESERLNVQQSGPHLTQAEIEANMKKVRQCMLGFSGYNLH